MKRFMLPLLALVLAAVFSSFDKRVQLKSDDPLWYYKEYTTSGHSNASNYELLTTQDQDDFCPGDSDVRCVIQAPVNGMTGLPNLSQAVVISRKP
jgi:hypothetical protein